MTQVYRAECDQFDDSATGYYATEAEAIEAFWTENTFSDRERQTVSVYATARDAADSDVREWALAMAEEGSPSPALGIGI